MTAWVPTWGMMTTRHLELRKRRVLMVVAAVLTVGPPVLVLGLRIVFHAIDPAAYGPAGSPGFFGALANLMAEFGFIAAAAIGATVATSDLTDGLFRQLVITGRSRLALYLARIPVGLAIILPLVAIAFTLVCLVTCLLGQPQPASLTVGGVSIPAHLSEAQLRGWVAANPGKAFQLLGAGPVPAQVGRAGAPAFIEHNMNSFYSSYLGQQDSLFNPAVNEMVKIGLWLELYVGVGFVVGLGLGSLVGQRTVPIVLLVVLQILVTPILAAHVVPYFLDGQRTFVGVALDQLRPAGLASETGGPGGPGGPGQLIFGGRGSLQIPPMPTWAMITVIAGWVAGWSGIGAWRMMTRDA
jgi:hypothetical protein